jgi:iron complex outermembrane recepter protein
MIITESDQRKDAVNRERGLRLVSRSFDNTTRLHAGRRGNNEMRSLRRDVFVGLVFFALVLIGGMRRAGAADAPPNGEPAPSVSPLPQLNPVVVTATRSEIPLQQVPTNITILTHEDIAESGALAVDDLLRQIPGFNTFRRSSSLVTAPAQDPEAQGVTLRGIGPGGASRALVLLDGMPLNDAFGGWLYWGELPLSSIERIEVVPGGNSTLWGNFALGGVINLITKEPTERAVDASILGGNRGTTDEVLSYTDVFGPLRVGVSGNFFHTEGWNIIAPSQRGPIDQDSGSEHKTLNGRLEYNPLPQFSLFLRGAYYDESRNTGTPLRISTTGRGFVTGGGRLQTQDGSDWQVSVFTHLSRFREHFSRVSEDRTSESPAQHQVVPSTDVGGALTWTRLFLTAHRLTAGMDFRLIEGESRDTFFSSSAVVTDRRVSRGKQNFFGFFIQDVYTPVERLHIALGLRLDYLRNFAGRVTDTPTDLLPELVTRFPGRSHTPFSPRLSFRYQLWPALAVRGAGYQAFRAPTLAELYRQSSVEGLVLRANPGLRPEYLEGGEIGFDYTGLTSLNTRLTAYWNNLRRPIANVTTAHDPVTGEDSERTRVNLGSARVRGIEADIEYQLTPRWSLSGSYLYSEAQLLDSPQDRDLEGKRLTQVPWYGGTVGIRYYHPSLLTVLVRGRFEGKKYEDADNHDTLGGYYIIDLTLSCPLPTSWFFPHLRGGRIFLSVQNLLDRTYAVDRGGNILKVGTPVLVAGGLQLRF